MPEPVRTCSRVLTAGLPHGAVRPGESRVVGGSRKRHLAASLGAASGVRFPSSEDGARGMLRGLVVGGWDYINTGPRVSADTGLGACVDVEKARVWMCLRRRRRGAAEEVDPVRDRPEGAGVVVDGKRTGKQLALSRRRSIPPRAGSRPRSPEEAAYGGSRGAPAPACAKGWRGACAVLWGPAGAGQG